MPGPHARNGSSPSLLPGLGCLPSFTAIKGSGEIIELKQGGLQIPPTHTRSQAPGLVSCGDPVAQHSPTLAYTCKLD